MDVFYCTSQDTKMKPHIEGGKGIKKAGRQKVERKRERAAERTCQAECVSWRDDNVA